MPKNLLRFLAAFSFVAFLTAAPILAKDQESATPSANDKAEASDTFKQLTLFSDILERVRADYVDPVTDDKLIETALNGMLSSLDPHSGYLNKKNFQEMQTQTKGELGGLGIEA